MPLRKLTVGLWLFNFLGFVSFICSCRFETWKGTQETFEKKKKLPRDQDDFLHFAKSFGFHKLSPQGCSKPFIRCAVDKLNFKGKALEYCVPEK